MEALMKRERSKPLASPAALRPLFTLAVMLWGPLAMAGAALAADGFQYALVQRDHDRQAAGRGRAHGSRGALLRDRRQGVRGPRPGRGRARGGDRGAHVAPGRGAGTTRQHAGRSRPATGRVGTAPGRGGAGAGPPREPRGTRLRSPSRRAGRAAPAAPRALGSGAITRRAPARAGSAATGAGPAPGRAGRAAWARHEAGVRADPEPRREGDRLGPGPARRLRLTAGY